MEFLSQLCLYQSLLLSACRQEEETVVAARLFPLYALDDEARVQIQSILHDETFEKLGSSSAVILHENFLRAFCSDENEFGCSWEEWEALEIKRKAYSVFEHVASDMNDLYDNLSISVAKNDKLSVTLALFYYLSDTKTELYIPLLRRAEGHGSAEAIVLLMALEEERRAALFEKLCINRELLLRNDNTLACLADYYTIEANKGVKNND